MMSSRNQSIYLEIFLNILLRNSQIFVFAIWAAIDWGLMIGQQDICSYAQIKEMTSQ